MSVWSSVSQENDKFDVASSWVEPTVRVTVYGTDGGFDEATTVLHPHEVLHLIRALAEALVRALSVAELDR